MRPRRRVGIVGAGFIADLHLEALRGIEGIDVAVVCDTDADRARRAAERWGISRSCTSLTEMLTAALDVVHVAVPPPAHARVVAQCVTAGCHVLVEKPATVSSEECRWLDQLAVSARRQVGVNHNATFHPAFQEALELIRSRRIGAVEHVVACWNAPLPQLEARQFDNWMLETTGNIVFEQAVHPLSQLHLLLGPAQSVTALAARPLLLPTGVPFFRSWQVGIAAARGTAQCFLGFGARFDESWLHIIGEDGSIVADLRRNTVRLHEKSRFLPPVDDLRDGWRGALDLARQSTRNVGRYALSFLKVARRADPFFVGMKDSIGAYHAALAAGQPPPAGLAEAEAVISTCERIVAAATPHVVEPEAAACSIQ